MAYIQGANPFSRRRGKAKREAKKQLKSLYKQGYSDITRTTQGDGSVSYSGAGEKGPEQKLDRRSRRNIRQEARGDKMTNDMNIDQKGPKTTEVKELGVNRMSSSPLHQDEYDWDETLNTTIDPRTGEVVYDDWGNETREKVEGGTNVMQDRNVTQTIGATTDQQATAEQLAEFKSRCIGPNGERLTNVPGCSWDDTVNTAKDTRTRFIDNPPEITIEEEPPVEIPTDNPDPIIPITGGGPTPTTDQITIGSNRRVKNEKVPVTTSKDVERRKPGMQKVCTNWEWVERGSGQGESRSDAGPRPTVTKTKTKTRMRRI